MSMTSKFTHKVHAIHSCFIFFALLIGMLIWPRASFATLNGHPVVISYGDSYSSGEGTPDFYDSEYLKSRDFDKLYDPKGDFLPHRSKNAWPGMLEIDGVTLKDIKDEGWYFLAVSGAVTENILEKDEKGSVVDGTHHKEYGQKKENGKWKEAWLQSQTAHLEALIKENKFQVNDIDYVTLTMGGNDVDFVGVVVMSLLNGASDMLNLISPGTFPKQSLNMDSTLSTGILDTKLLFALNKFDTTTSSRLLETYKTIDKSCGNNEQIIVAGYPHLFPKNGSLININTSNALLKGIYRLFLAQWINVSITDSQHVNACIDVFDECIELLVNNSGMSNLHYAEVRDTFTKYGEDCINPVYVFPFEQDIKQAPPSGYSVHPNEKGQRAYAEAVQKVIKSIESNKVTQAQASTETGEDKAQQDQAIASDLSISIVMDVSGSMGESSAYGNETKLERAKQQSLGFVRGSIRSSGEAPGLSTKVGVCSFSGDAATDCPLSSNVDEVEQALANLQPMNMTNIYAGLQSGIAQLTGLDGTKIMMFLSDGLANEGPDANAILQLAQDAADAEITIYTIGYGPSGNLDESLLQQIAQITGGSYSHEDPSNASSAAVGLFATMMEAQLKATQQLLISNTGSVTQGGTVDTGSFDVNTSGDLTCYLYWPGSALDIVLIDPDGNEVGPSYAGYTIDDSSIPTRLTITDAKQGTWNMSVYGREVSMAEEPFYAVAAFDEHETLTPVPSGGGGGATDASGILLFLFGIAFVGGLLGVYALSIRK